jgi:sulfate permease, SulP family
VLVVLYASPLYFANAANFRIQVDKALRHPSSCPNVFVLDVVGMHDIDFTGARVLNDVLDELDRQHITFALTSAGNRLRENLARSGLLKRIGPDRLFPSVDDAVKALGPENNS